MKTEPGYCDDCGCKTAAAWLSIDGAERCDECALKAVGRGSTVVMAKRPEARDDGR